jgi:hypothetical protein
MQQLIFQQSQKEAHNMSNYPLRFFSNKENFACNLDEPGIEFNSLEKVPKPRYALWTSRKHLLFETT